MRSSADCLSWWLMDGKLITASCRLSSTLNNGFGWGAHTPVGTVDGTYAAWAAGKQVSKVHRLYKYTKTIYIY